MILTEHNSMHKHLYKEVTSMEAFSIAPAISLQCIHENVRTVHGKKWYTYKHVDPITISVL